MFSVNWIQHPIGHGGFHTGILDTGDQSFCWIFDCGARNTRDFNKYLKSWTNNHQLPIDWLFISHFDTDHVSGLDELMSRARVRDVMVPFVNERELAYALLHEINRGNQSRYFIELIADPALFLLSRGADRVTFLGGEDPEDDELGREGFPKDDTGARTLILPKPQQLGPMIELSKWSKENIAAQRISQNTCNIDTVFNSAGLRLKPHRLPIESSIHKDLLEDLKTLVNAKSGLLLRPGLGTLAYAIASHARTKSGRASLRSIFKKYIGSSNRSSLSLLSIPYCRDWSFWEVSSYRMSTNDRGIAAWLNTGDAELLDARDLRSWQKAYRSYLPDVRVLALPHHGSDRNSNVGLQNLCPEAALAAHAKSASTKHPGTFVSMTAGSRLVPVTEDHRTVLQMSFQASFP